MKHILIPICWAMIYIALIIAVVVLCFYKNGWYWLLLLLVPTYRYTTGDNDDRKIPKKAFLKLGHDQIYSIVHIWWDTQQVTLKERPNVINTVDFRDVEFIVDKEGE